MIQDECQTLIFECLYRRFPSLVSGAPQAPILKGLCHISPAVATSTLRWSGFQNPAFAGKLKVVGQAENGKTVGEGVVYRPDGQVDSLATILEDGQIQPSIGSRELAQKDLKADERYFRTLERAVLDSVAEK